MALELPTISRSDYDGLIAIMRGDILRAQRGIQAYLRAVIRQIIKNIRAGMPLDLVVRDALKWEDLAEIKEEPALGMAADGYLYGANVLNPPKSLNAFDLLAKQALAFADRELAEGHLAAQVGEWVTRTAKLETETSAKDLERILKKIIAGMEEDAAQELGPSILSLEGIDQIEDAFILSGNAWSSARALLMARTMTIWTHNEGSMQSYKDAGIVTLEWYTTEDDLVCDWCRPLDGKKVSINSEFVGAAGITVEVETQNGPRQRTLKVPEPVVHPPLHPHCRCVVLPVLD
jgi:hypothetical protein